MRSEERLTAASLRAVAGEPKAEIRGHRLEVDYRPVGIVVPYLSLEFDDHDERRRGVADALGLRLRHSDRNLHLELSPTVPVERIIFDICEQFRCEARADPSLIGLRGNIKIAFDRWSDHALGNGIGETGTGLLVFTVTHMLRARLLRQFAKENVDDLIEGTRANLGKLVGHAFREMPLHVHDQRAFAVPALEMARLIGEMLDDATLGGKQVEAAIKRNRMLIPIGWETLEEEIEFVASPAHLVEPVSDYRVYTRANDVQVSGDELYREFALGGLRNDLDAAISQQAVSISRLAQRLGPLFHQPVDGGLIGGQDHGRIDRSRLAQIVADPLNPYVHALPVQRPATNAAVTFVVDTTGSMKVQHYEAVAVLCDSYVRALEALDVQTEVLGFSTNSWAGGASLRQWEEAGSPVDPGRVADTLHIVYKSFGRTWRQSRKSLAAMMRVDHYREGVDGEAVRWAAERLLSSGAERKYLVLISDGQPMEAATATHNRSLYLVDHLRFVVDRIQRTTDIRLGAVSVDHTLDEFITNSTVADLAGTLTLSSYGVLARLFGQSTV